MSTSLLCVIFSVWRAMCDVCGCELCALSGSLCVEHFVIFYECSAGACVCGVCCECTMCVMGSLLLVEYIVLHTFSVWRAMCHGCGRELCVVCTEWFFVCCISCHFL